MTKLHLDICGQYVDTSKLNDASFMEIIRYFCRLKPLHYGRGFNKPSRKETFAKDTSERISSDDVQNSSMNKSFFDIDKYNVVYKEVDIPGVGIRVMKVKVY